MPNPNDHTHQLQDMGIPITTSNNDNSDSRNRGEDHLQTDDQINQEALLAYYNTSGGSMHPSSSGIAPPSGRFTPYTAYQGNTQGNAVAGSPNFEGNTYPLPQMNNFIHESSTPSGSGHGDGTEVDIIIQRSNGAILNGWLKPLHWRSSNTSF